MDEIEYKKIIQNFKKKPHVVILGAGASIAAISNGDRNGKKISVMNNFINELDMNEIISSVELLTKSSNLEDIYSELHERSDCGNVRKQLESRIHDYFTQLQLPDEPTVYDYLLLSLREKDVIATFNWDDLIIKAWQRVAKIVGDARMPQLIFLHGNVGVGYCQKDKSIGAIQLKCNQCGRKYEPTRLLYPIKNKNYNQDIIIKNAWGVLTEFLNHAAMVTIFGYSAPHSDVEAKALLKNAFDCFNGDKRFLETIEIIDRPGADHNYLRQNWSDFISVTRDHYKIRDSFFNSYLAEFPRRSIEGYTKRNIEGWWGGSTISLKNDNIGFSDIQKLIAPLLSAEIDDNFNVI